ncbi:GGDEF domain-containing protein [Paraburkholderia sp. LEh10]|uniref:GGDEF domain-containing protein n=1 Tax=Paraburkholderia sp. LEh10 TaxID=2821353 RepID=UPI001AE457C9|nr:GGDEF domain-containing protein [Paraburkholderia sp. LEh10]MBP0589771.1 GGDEF domain-containing protein [Paraburkholderia sp. LEh10]
MKRNVAPDRRLRPQWRPQPIAVGVVALICLVIGLLYVAVQVKALFSDHFQLQYASLVLEAAERAEGARNAASLSTQLAPNRPAKPADQPSIPPSKQSSNRPPNRQSNAPPGANGANGEVQRALTDLQTHIVELDRLLGSSPIPAQRVPQSDATTQSTRSLYDLKHALAAIADDWRERRDAISADVHRRTMRIASVLAVLTVVVVGALLAALVVFARRHRRLAGLTHQFRHAAQHDAMTGLPNRQQLLAQLDRIAAEREQRTCAVLYIDLDGFKQVNDTWGHAIGDDFLIAVAQRFRQSLRPGDLVARMGGDEFAALVSGFRGDAELTGIATRLMNCVGDTDAHMGLGLVRASVGIATFPDRVPDHRLLVAAADGAMYEVKRSGKNGYAFAARSI